MIHNLIERFPVLSNLRNKLFPSKETISQAELSAQRFLNVKDIHRRTLYTKDNYVFSYLRLQPISIDLLSKNEKKVLVNNLSSELSTLEKPFKFFCISRPVDIGNLIDELMELYSTCNDDVQKRLLEQEIKLYNHFSMSGEVIERQFYMIIWEPFAEEADYILSRRAKELVNKFRNCGVSSEILNESQIVQLCNQFANPGYAFMEDTEVSSAIPILNEKGMC